MESGLLTQNANYPSLPSFDLRLVLDCQSRSLPMSASPTGCMASLSLLFPLFGFAFPGPRQLDEDLALEPRVPRSNEAPAAALLERLRQRVPIGQHRGTG